MTVRPPTHTAPIACTLGGGEYAERIRWIEALNRSSLRGHRQDGFVLVLEYAPEAAAQLGDLVERERRCCAFLAFHVDESARNVRLRIEAPPEVRESIDVIFAPFLAGTSGSPGG